MTCPSLPARDRDFPATTRGASTGVIAIERPTPALFAAFAEPPVFAGWAFLVLGGSIAAYTIYLKLLRDWGPTAAGGYAFVSPTIALAFGALVLGERYTATEGVGAAIMLTATLLMLRTTGRCEDPWRD